MDERASRLGRRSSRLKELRRRVRSRAAGEVIIDGRRLIEDLVRWGVPVRELYIGESAAVELESWEPATVSQQAFTVDDTVLAGLAPTRHPQGVLAVVDEPSDGGWEPMVGVGVFLDTVQDPGNVGAVVRSAAAFGAGVVLLGPACADPFHPAAVRGSAGAVFRVPVIRDADPTTWASAAREAGGSVWGTDTDGTSVDRWSPRDPVLLLAGSEGMGLAPGTAALADGTVTIPLDRDVESLNVAVAVGVLLFAAGGETRNAV